VLMYFSSVSILVDWMNLNAICKWLIMFGLGGFRG
jgi:hypothetical protein